MLLQHAEFPEEDRQQLIESMLAEYGPADDPQGMGSALVARMVVHMHRQEVDKAIADGKLAIEYGLRCQETLPEVWFDATVHRARMALEAGDHPLTRQLCEAALEFATPYENRLKVSRPLRLLGFSASRQGMMEESIRYAQLEYELALRKNNKTDCVAAIEAISTKFLNIGQIETAAEWISKAESMLDQIPDRRLKLIIQMRRERIRAALGDAATAAVNLKKLLDQDISPLRFDEQKMLLLGLANAQHKNNDPAAALETLDRMAAETVEDVDLLSGFLRITCLIELERFAEAVEILESIQPQTSVSPNDEERRLLLLSMALGGMKDFERAYSVLEQCRQVSVQNSLEQTTRIMAEASARLENKEQQLKLVEAQKKKQEAELLAEQSQTAARQSQLEAERSKAAADRARLIRNQGIAAALGIAVVATLLIRGRGERKLRLRERHLNGELQKQLAAQEKQLLASEAEKLQLELGLERQRRDRAIGQLTGGVAHDFNNLLTVVLQANELISLCEEHLQPASRQMIDASTRAAQTGAGIVRQLLTFTRQTALAPSEISVSDWLNSNMHLFRSTTTETIELSVNNSSRDTWLQIDAAQLTTAMINLLCNARDAINDRSDPNADHGRVDIEVSCLTPAKLTWEAVIEPDVSLLVEICVRDNGCGMTTDQLQHACEPFFTTRASGAGTGLGLSTVAGFIRQSGGDIRIESKVGEGTTVTLVLPAITSAPSTTNESAKQDPPTDGTTLLLVDDQQQIREITAMRLRLMGYNIETVGSGVEALQYIQQNGPPQIVLSDIRMPGAIDGIALRRKLTQAYPALHVVLMSGYAGELPPDAGQVLMKPFTTEQLLSAIRFQPV